MKGDWAVIRNNYVCATLYRQNAIMVSFGKRTFGICFGYRGDLNANECRIYFGQKHVIWIGESK